MREPGILPISATARSRFSSRSPRFDPRQTYAAESMGRVDHKRLFSSTVHYATEKYPPTCTLHFGAGNTASCRCRPFPTIPGTLWPFLRSRQVEESLERDSFPFRFCSWGKGECPQLPNPGHFPSGFSTKLRMQLMMLKTRAPRKALQNPATKKPLTRRESR